MRLSIKSILTAEEELARLQAIFQPPLDANGEYPIDEETGHLIDLLSLHAPAEAMQIKATLLTNPMHFQSRLGLCEALQTNIPLSRPEAQRFAEFAICLRRGMEAFTFGESLLANAPKETRHHFLNAQAFAGRLTGERMIRFSEMRADRLTDAVAFLRKGVRDGHGCTPDPYDCIAASANLLLALHLKRAPASDLQAALSELKQTPSLPIDWPDPWSVHLQLSGIRRQAIWDPADIAWLPEVAARSGAIREELEKYIRSRDAASKGTTWENQPRSAYLAGSAEWNSVELFMDGEWNAANCRHFPKTCGMLRERPELQPENFRWPASVLAQPGGAQKLRPPAVMVNIYQAVPGAFIRPHFGSHSRLVASMGLKVPPGAVLQVGKEKRNWQEGQWLLFDDAFMHQVINNSTEPRYVLAVAMFHPECCTSR